MEDLAHLYLCKNKINGGESSIITTRYREKKKLKNKNKIKRKKIGRRQGQKGGRAGGGAEEAVVAQSQSEWLSLAPIDIVYFFFSLSSSGGRKGEDDGIAVSVDSNAISGSLCAKEKNKPFCEWLYERLQGVMSTRIGI